MSKTRTLAALFAAATLALTGCGSDENDSESADGGGPNHNQADIGFASDMIPHHAQALQMVDLTVDRDLDPKVQKLAEDIRMAQAPEIESMARWLQSWDEPVPETSRDHANSHGDGMEMDMDSDMPGMMSGEEMQALAGATDAEFQDLWLQMMIEHHQGAIEMAKAEQQDGEYPPAVALAEQIETGQAKDIRIMQKLLAG